MPDSESAEEKSKAAEREIEIQHWLHFFFFFVFLGPHPTAYGGSQARVESEL